MNLLSIGNAQSLKHAHQTLGTEETHQIIFQGNEELGLSGISLSSRTTAKLVINTSGLMPLRTHNMKTARCSCFLIQLNIGTTAGHVGRNGYRTVHTGFRNNRRFLLMKLCI